MVSPTLSVLYSELVLSLYPILIKVVQTNTYNQLLARFLVFPILAFIGGTVYQHALWDSTSDWISAFFMNILNMVHIGVSYTAFKDLPAGTAISLFYMYPIFNVIAGALLFGESMSLLSIGLILVAFAGTYLIATSHQEETKADDNSTYCKGVTMGILAAITETLIFVFVRSNKKAQQSPFYAISQLYPYGLLALIGYGLLHTDVIDTTPMNWVYLLGFNAILGFTGYLARFYGISNVSTIIFSLLSFIGVVGGYVWGILFTDDKPALQAILGGGCIASSIAILRYFSA
jgi:drug/metabolite transporter (DMT)-like permease